jgi:hypothetical protein
VTQFDFPRPDGRVTEILSDPDGYFARAYARAWSSAEAEIDADLAERAKHRGDDHAGPAHAPTWLPSITQLSTRP